MRKFAQFRHSPAGWLWEIVRSELAGHFRRRRPMQHGDQPVPDLGRTPDDRIEQQEDRRRMHSALGELPDEHQRILYMKFFQDMRNADIAAALGLSRSHVGVLVHRSLKRLRARMEPARAPQPKAETPR